MPKIYLCPEGPNRICTIISKDDADSLIRKDPDWDVYVLDVERYVPTPPKKARHVVVDGDGDALMRRNYFTFCLADNEEAAVSYANESDAIILRDVLTRGGMTGLSIRKIDGE